MNNPNRLALSAPKLDQKRLDRTGLNKGKAPGTQCDSLDIFYKLARLIQRRRNQTDIISPSDVTQFFQNIANAEIPSRIIQILRMTYLVAHEKDPEDTTKLRPLGIPSAIRRITAIALLKQFTPLFTRDLLPYNFPVRVHRATWSYLPSETAWKNTSACHNPTTPYQHAH